MADARRNDHVFSSEVGIPSGLNRIKTPRVLLKEQPSSKPGELNESRTSKNKQKSVARGHGQKSGKKMARWLLSYISRNSTQAFNNVTNIEDGVSEVKTRDKEPVRTKLGYMENKNGKQSSAENACYRIVSKGLKSFSHELGPKGGNPSAYPRAHSYNDLKELFGSLHSRFDAAKEVVDTELATFAGDVMDVLQTIDSSSQEGRKMAEDLLLLAQQCVEMTCTEFRLKCETIVQDLTEKRQQCQTVLVKWLCTRMLFILTRCTRLLQFQKEKEPIDENSLNKFKKCLESIPAVEMSWSLTSEVADSHSANAVHQKAGGEHNLQGQNKVPLFPEPGGQNGITSGKGSTNSEKISAAQGSQSDFTSQEQQFCHPGGHFVGDSVTNFCYSSLHEHNHNFHGSLSEPEQTLDGSDSVICRICEVAVPISHLESHSYICAYADKCALNCIDVDECLVKLAEILELIIESRNLNSIGSPENSRMQNLSSAVTSEGYSPKISEWRNKGVEGMFEDIHEMDTASIEDSHLASIDFKGHLGMRLGNHGAASSTGSMTSLSSTNTPRGSHFDSFWLERNNPSELEDVQQMVDLADIARCVADTDLLKEGSHEFLLACMQDLQDVLQHSELKALVIDTFGGRIETLLREKCILACEAADIKSPTSCIEQRENSRHLSDNASQSSTVSTPLHMSHKERTTIDDFEIIKPISRGAFGKVFLARKRTTGDLFAIKVLKKLDMIRKNDIERILAERNILIAVRNPFVVRFFYSFTCRDNLYLVMEYLNGGDLYSLLRKVGCLDEEVARTYIAELVLALEYLHSVGIVHRDLKPDNILIAHDGHIKLTDFGLSKIGLINNTIDLSGPETTGTTSLDTCNLHKQQMEDRSRHSAVGTPDYLAPEILLGTEHGYAADWWSVGIILFEFITGIPPFAAECPEIIFDNILNRKIPWPSVPSEMSYEAQDLINRLLTHDPKQRLGANGATEVKAHAFFNGVNWDSLALQKAAFVPHTDSADDTSYFLSRFSQISGGIPENECSSSDNETYDSGSNTGPEMDECGDLAEFDSSPLNLSLINFSFKNLSQLASINHDVLVQSGKDSAKSSPSRGLGI
ncbi:hypothetical protein V6Z11_D05G207200 [Gossypium hirsutum]|uniref:non-specific serine/threonine protein kinase n=3 Tax=Gossypium TaxID=3633 RepID=A0ABM3A5H1_GOSHI|nr:probable serine/threonine protein kinase IRE4 isoform X1 [Gossypium hirsutum]XP_040950033.1 probable serine/threonine protein kinase IRE4 isoform X1 [Gossypium hirsutum]